MKKVLSLLLVMIMALTVMLVVIPPIEASAASTYEFLFPVNNGGVNIAYVYGYSAAYFDNTVFHYGIDIHSSKDQVIYSAFSGTVVKVNNSCGHVNYGQNCGHDGGFGNSIYIKSTDGKLCAIYGHLKQHSMLVKEGDYVEQGQPIASMGSAGWSTGKHLHFEVRTSQTSQASAINVNKGSVNYITTGYKPMQSDTIKEGTYKFNNDGYRMYMIKDESNLNTLGASSSSVTSKFEFNVIKDGNYYRVVPKDGSKNYLNSFWSDSYVTHTLNGSEVTLCINDTNDHSQKWIFEKYGDGYLIHPACTPAFSLTRDGSKLVVKATTKAANQIWKLEGNCDHSYTYKSNSSGHWKECVQCGEKQTTSSHTYTNDCDKSCNTCGYTRTTSHAYSNSCDTSCNVCGYTRTITHTYTNSCDKTCNVCGSTRTITHSYNHDCDTDCNVCGEIRTTSHSYGSYSCDSDHHWRTCTICNSSVISQPHYYTNKCDTSCNACGYERTITHSYDNDCDTGCNVCGEARTTEHVYDDEQDTTCNVCSEVRTVETLPSNSDEAEPSTKPGDKPDTDDTQSISNKKDNDDNNDEDDEDEENDNTTIIIVAIAGAVTVSAVSIFGTALVMKKKH